MSILDTLLPKIEHLGVLAYWVVFLVSTLESTVVVGLIIPGTTIIIFVGFLVAQEVLDLGDVIWYVALGGIIGDAISFYLGRRGTNLFKNENKYLKAAYLAKGEEFFGRWGSMSIVLARFIGPLRPMVPFAAGLSKMPAKKFLILNVLSGFAAAAVYVLIGYFFGEAWGRAHAWISHFKAGLLILVAALLAGYLIRKRLK